MAKYEFEGLPNKVSRRSYLTDLPDEKRFAEEIEKTRPEIEARRRPREEQVVEGPPV